MTTTIDKVSLGRTLIATTVAAVLLTACAAAPVAPEGASEARAKLTQLQSDPSMASRAPLAIKDADAAVSVAEQPEADKSLAAHRVLIADRKVEIAKAQAETSLWEDQRAALVAARETARLDSRTREVDTARMATADAEAQTAELQRQIAALQAKVTDRGVVLTLGDVLFASGKADLKEGAASHLNQLVAFLREYPSRTVVIEGHTDSVGSDDLNQALSQRRADSVRSYLVGRESTLARLTTMGAGEGTPVAENDSATGRQQNRRVEVIISNPTLAAS